MKSPDVISQALSGTAVGPVDGPYSVLFSAPARLHQRLADFRHGYPIREHLNRLVDGDIIWAPAVDGARSC